MYGAVRLRLEYMGKRGTPKTPTKLKMIRGTAKPTQKEIQPEKPETSAAPEELYPKLEKLGLLTNIDLIGFSRYCDMFPKWLKAKKTLDERGFYYPIYHKQTRAEIKAKQPPRIKYLNQFPEVSIYTQLGRELSKLEQLFGMNPSARVNLDITLENPKNEVEDKLFG
jgi:P27 family predicted phage terminase small subunit